jgi:hypothetical protein
MSRHTRLILGAATAAGLMVSSTAAFASATTSPHPTQTTQVRAGLGQSAPDDARGSDDPSGTRHRRCRDRTLPQGSEPVILRPAEFTTEIDNPYWPMTPGSRWVYSVDDSEGNHEDVVVEVTDETKMIANGVEARVIIDTVMQDGQISEQTQDWYAQDRCGNIWYLGERVDNYEDGVIVNHDGSFEAGVDGAQPGIAMPARPRPGLSYRQEYYAGVAEDTGAIITIGQEQVEVPYGFFDTGVLMTRDLVPLEPTVQELKFYAPGIGPLMSVHLDGAGGRAVLVEFTPGA